MTYATDIKPIFETSCVKCHSGEKPKARLKLDTLEGALKGSKDGKIVTAGDSANSFVVKCIAHATDDHDSWMPPEHNKAQYRAAYRRANRPGPRLDRPGEQSNSKTFLANKWRNP